MARSYFKLAIIANLLVHPWNAYAQDPQIIGTIGEYTIGYADVNFISNDTFKVIIAQVGPKDGIVGGWIMSCRYRTAALTGTILTDGEGNQRGPGSFVDIPTPVNVVKGTPGDNVLNRVCGSKI